MTLRKLQELNLDNKTIILRVDYNVPISSDGEINDNSRIVMSLPTIHYLLEHHCKIIIISHLGRPEGHINRDLSLEKVSKELSKLLNKQVIFIDDCLKDGLKELVDSNSPETIFLLENLRFYPEEKNNDLEFAQKLADLGNIYISDAFGSVHRKHASIYQLAKLLPSAAGFLLQKEIKVLTKILINPKHPFTLVAGGAKIETKLGLLENFLNRCEHICLGGGLSNTFLKAKGMEIGQSYHQDQYLDKARMILKKSENKIILPTDYLVTQEQLNNNTTLTKKIASEIKSQDNIVDLGPKSAAYYSQIILNSKTVVWNGPVGVYEYKPMRGGTETIIKALISAQQNGTEVIIGGGDSLDALKLFGINNDTFTHVSSGGGAMLQFLEGKSLPGIEVLSN